MVKVNHPPVIIIGMHRSGTSLISKVLEEFGIFMGYDKDNNNEARFFKNINYWLLRQTGGAWDFPEKVNLLIENQQARSLAVKFIKSLMGTPYAIRYLGLLRYLRFHNPGKINQPWGWKDPRNTFTLPLWLDIYPNARVIHIFRHGVDVASSLKRRHLDLLEKSQKHFHRKPLRFSLNWYKRKHIGLTNTYRCESLVEGFSLWESYIRTGHKHVEKLSDQALEMKYEDFINYPGENIKKMIKFCGLSHNKSLISKIVKRVDPLRAYAYLGDENLRVFSEKMKSELNKFGY